LGTLYGRQSGLSAVERVTLCRNVRRLVANGMIASQDGTRRFRLTEKGQVWLQTHAPPEPSEPPQVRPEGLSRAQRLATWEGLVRSAAKSLDHNVQALGRALDEIHPHELWKDDHPDCSLGYMH
jgi:hypothetical protein